MELRDLRGELTGTRLAIELALSLLIEGDRIPLNAVVSAVRGKVLAS